MKQILRKVFLTLGFLVAAGSGTAAAQTATGTLDRTVLPIPEPEHSPITELDARNATAPPRIHTLGDLRAPA